MTGLEALNKIDNEVLYGIYAQEHYSNEIETIRKSLKALEIIKEKTVSIFQLSCCKNVNEYNDLRFKFSEKLTQEEFNLLRSVLE